MEREWSRSDAHFPCRRTKWNTLVWRVSYRARVPCAINCCYANRERVQVRDDDWWMNDRRRLIAMVVPTELWVKCWQTTVTALAALIVREERTVSRRFRPRCPIVSVNKFFAARVSAHLIKTERGWTPFYVFVSLKISSPSSSKCTQNVQC